MKGYIKNINNEKKFGFIKATDEVEYFFHKSAFQGFWDDLVKDMKEKRIEVTFEPEQGKKGPRASNVVRIDVGLNV